MRGRVAHRLHRINWKHTDHAWERRHRDPLSPYGLALFFLDTDGDPAQGFLRTATRLNPDGPEFSDLPRVIYDFGQAVIRYRHADRGVLDLTDRSEPMTSQAIFIGAGVSSLDTPTGSWAQVRGKARDAMSIPGSCYAVLTDATVLSCDRGGYDQFRRFAITCNNTVNETTWQWEPDLAARDDIRPVAEQLGELNRIIGEGTLW